VRQAREICNERDWLLLFDEVQTGIARTGGWFAYQGMGVTPDACSFAKGIAGGLPMGGFLVSEHLRGVLVPGDHATTFGGNLICCAAALATLNILEAAQPGISEKGEYIRSKVEAMNLPAVAGVRGKGLMVGVKLAEGFAPAEVNKKLLEAGLVSLTAGSDVIRFLPPLVISMDDLDAGLDIFRRVLQSL
ncbi:MAG: aminotransferase class III-fold pyridoxal phosphate-dependent enzyme, partial [Defluviitaleaceae bacterium]|nr:aminotransferase class III-fold pyridoxal phosphate-dependent enzyme [Defluviitaleaceae bacterium]